MQKTDAEKTLQNAACNFGNYEQDNFWRPLSGFLQLVFSHNEWNMKEDSQQSLALNIAVLPIELLRTSCIHFCFNISHRTLYFRLGRFKKDQIISDVKFGCAHVNIFFCCSHQNLRHMSDNSLYYYSSPIDNWKWVWEREQIEVCTLLARAASCVEMLSQCQVWWPSSCSSDSEWHR